MARTITDNPGGWSRSLPGHTVEYEPSFAQPFYYGTSIALGAGESGTYTLTFTDTAHIFFIDMVNITPQSYKELNAIVEVNDVPYVAASGIGWLNLPLRQNPSIQLIAGDKIDVIVNNQDGNTRTMLIKIHGTKIVRPANFGHAPGAYFTYVGPLGNVDPILLRAAEVSGVGNPAQAVCSFGPVDCSGISKSNGYLRIDLKVSDPALMHSSGQIEVTSGGTNDVNEWHREDLHLLGLTADYVQYDLPLSLFITTNGELNVAAVNFIRWYQSSVGADIGIYWRNAYLYGVGNGEVVFTDGSTNSPTSWEWDFGDGSPVSTEQNPTHVYALPGSYYPRLKAGNVYGYDFYGLSTPIVVT